MKKAARTMPGSDIPWIGTPAFRALAAAGITKRAQLTNRSTAKLLAIHGVGPKAIALLKAAGVKLKP